MSDPTPVDADPGSSGVRWSGRAHALAEIDGQLAAAWRMPAAAAASDDAAGEARVSARTSVLNLVVIAEQPDLANRARSAVIRLTGRQPSRTLILSPVDRDGPSRLDAEMEIRCTTSRRGGPATCGDVILASAGGEAGQHLDSLIPPLLIHDLPVVLWWPGEPPLGSTRAADLAAIASTVVVDGSGWGGSGLARLREFAGLADGRLNLVDFALARQARWREAIASTFDQPEFLPYLRAIRRIEVTYATPGPLEDPEGANVVKPVYHVAWLISRLGMHVTHPLRPVPGAGGFEAVMGAARRRVEVRLVPLRSSMPAGSTLRVELIAERHGSALEVTVSGEAEAVHVEVRLAGQLVLHRPFAAPRRTEIELLAGAIESSNGGRLAADAIQAAGQMVGTRVEEAAP